jgi:hypothetical protein
MSEIIIKDFDDRRWMRSEVFGELVRIANEENWFTKEAEKHAACPGCQCQSEDNFDDDVEADLAENEEFKKAYEEDKKKFAEFAGILFKKAERLTKQGDHAEAFKLERRARLIKDELRKAEIAMDEFGTE